MKFLASTCLLFACLAFVQTAPASAVEREDPAISLSFFFDARNGIERLGPGDFGYGLIESAVFVGDPIVLTLSVLNAPGPAEDVAPKVLWSFETATGARVQPTVVRDPQGRPRVPLMHARRQDATQIVFRVTDLPAGRYMVWPSMLDPRTGKMVRGPARKLSLYRGDENDVVRRAFMRDRAQRAAALGTREGYETAKQMWLQAADGSTDPGIYEELADASAPWAPPAETAQFYQRALDVARKNIERNFGSDPQRWPSRVQQVHEIRAKKVEAFRSLVPYYTMYFDSVRVVPRRNGLHGFLVQRRKDGAVLRTIDVR